MIMVLRHFALFYHTTLSFILYFLLVIYLPRSQQGQRCCCSQQRAYKIMIYLINVVRYAVMYIFCQRFST